MRVTILVNTPYHLYMAYIITGIIKELSKDTIVDLICLENTMIWFSSIEKSKTPWDTIHYFPKCKENRYSRLLLSSFSRVYSAKYMKKAKPDVLISFVDHIPYNSNIIYYFRKYRSNGKYILIEEGIAPYNSVLNNKLKISKIRIFLKKLTVGGNIKALPLGRVFKPDLGIVSSKEHVVEGYAKNAELVEWPKGAFPTFLTKKFLNIFEMSFGVEDNSILYLSQPLSEDAHISSSQEEDNIRILSELTRNLDIKVFVKLHPRESEQKKELYESYGLPCISIPKNIPIECLFSTINFKAIVTPASSAAINYTMRYGGMAVWLEELFMGSSNISILDTNKSDLIKIPKNYQELESIMLDLKMNSIKQVHSRNIDEWKSMIGSIVRK